MGDWVYVRGLAVRVLDEGLTNGLGNPLCNLCRHLFLLTCKQGAGLLVWVMMMLIVGWRTKEKGMMD